MSCVEAGLRSGSKLNQAQNQAIKALLGADQVIKVTSELLRNQQSVNLLGLYILYSLNACLSQQKFVELNLVRRGLKSKFSRENP